MRVVFDTDGGVDDAIALALLLRSPNVELVAVTAVDGNVNVNQVAVNVRKVLEYFGRADVPVFRGAAGPLLGERTAETWPGHGHDGLGGTGAFAAPLSVEAEGTAAEALVRLASEGRPFTLVAVGPLTNVALALRLDRSFVARLESLVVMGGSVHAMGNGNLAAEYNFFCDPEAARIVLSACDAQHKCVLVPWELCVDSHLTWDEYDSLVGPSTAGAAETALPQHSGRFFLRTVSAAYVDWSRPRFEATKAHHAFLPCDAYAAAVAALPGIVTASRDMYGQVETSGTLTRGMCVWDWYGRTGHAENARIITAIDRVAFIECLRRTFA